MHMHVDGSVQERCRPGAVINVLFFSFLCVGQKQAAKKCANREKMCKPGQKAGIADHQKKKPIKSCTLPHERAKRRSVFSPLSFFSFLPCFVSALNEREGTQHTCVK